MLMRFRSLGLAFVTVSLLTAAVGAGAVYAQAATTVGLSEFVFTPDRFAVGAGARTFTLRNTGMNPHNMHIEGNGISVDVKPDGPVMAGQTFTGTVTLAAGTYQVWCPVGTHRDRGMVGTLTVAAAGAAAQVPGALPRTGDAESTPLVGALAVLAGGALLVAGWASRRRAIATRDR
jgi:plastocyanin